MTTVVRSFETLIESVLDFFFRMAVERARRFVENQDRRRLQNRARDRDALLLAARKFQAPLADHRVVTVGQRADEIVDLRQLCGRDRLRRPSHRRGRT